MLRTVRLLNKSRIDPDLTLPEIAVTIREYLLSLPIMSGARIFEAHIARESGFSRPVVRDACRILENEGLLTYTTNKGYSLRQLKPQEVRQLVEFRMILEEAAFVFAASQRDRQRVSQRMRTAYDDIKQLSGSEDAVKQISADLAFHRVVIEEMDNSWVLQSFDRMTTQLLYIMRLLNLSTSDFKVYGPSHEMLIKWIENGDHERVRSSIRKHIDTFVPTLLKRVKELAALQDFETEA